MKAPQDDPASAWSYLHGERGSLLDRCEEYAFWTVPSICPKENLNDLRQEKGHVAIGARLVNHLANRIVDTMFPSDKPFFLLEVTSEIEAKLKEEVAPEQLDELLQQIKMQTTSAEDAAMRKMDVTAYRPVAVQAVQHQIVTGNAVIHRTDSGHRVVYGIRDFCVTRDMRGELRVCILRDSRRFDTLDKDIQQMLLAGDHREYEDKTDVLIYTCYWREEGRWHRIQQADTALLRDTRRSYRDEDCPIIALTWNLSRGDNYGRGLVEDHAVTFNNIHVFTRSLLSLITVAGDIKILVAPDAITSALEFNNAATGSYILGNKDDINIADLSVGADIQLIHTAIKEWERELAQSFLMNSAGVRNAERVTAEEIRFYARELAGAYGGLYSRLALQWQKREAEYLVSQLDLPLTLDSGIQIFDIKVVTGLESLSRDGKLDNLRLAISDLQMLEAVPPDMREVMDSRKLAQFIFSNRGINLGEFLYSEEDMARRQQAIQQQQSQQMNDEAAHRMAEASVTQTTGGR